MSVRPDSTSITRNPPMMDQTMSSIATQSVTATAAKRGMTLLVRYRRVRRDWYTGGTVGKGGGGKSGAAMLLSAMGAAGEQPAGAEAAGPDCGLRIWDWAVLRRGATAQSTRGKVK